MYIPLSQIQNCSQNVWNKMIKITNPEKNNKSFEKGTFALYVGRSECGYLLILLFLKLIYLLFNKKRVITADSVNIFFT